MRWLLKSADPLQVRSLASALPQNSLTLAHLLVLRGIKDAENADRFLRPSLEHLHSPYALSGMKAAVERLAAAIARKEDILIYGDYDVDGTTAIIILKTAIEFRRRSLTVDVTL